MSAPTPRIDCKVDATACPCCCSPVLVLVFRRLDIHLAEKADDDGEDEGRMSSLVGGSSNKVCRSDILESIIRGASVGGDG